MNKYSLYGINLNDDADVFIGGISSQGLDLGNQLDVEITNDKYAKWYGISGMEPDGRFTTFHLATALGALGQEGLKLSSLTTGLEMWLQLHVDESSRAGVTSHRKFTMTKGLLVPRTLTVTHGAGQHASLSCQIITTGDGVNCPVSLTDDQTLPTAEADDERFAMGPITIGGKSLTDFRQLEIDFGLNVVPEGGNSGLSPTFCSIETITPVITARGIDPEWLKAANIPLTGLACTFANTILYLRKRTIGAASFVIDATEEHISFKAVGLAHVTTAFDSSGQAASETSIAIPLIGDGTNAPLTINPATAIT